MVRIAIVGAVFAVAGVAASTVIASRDKVCTLMGGPTGIHVGLGLDRLHRAARTFSNRTDYFDLSIAQRRDKFRRLIRAHGVRGVRLCTDDTCRDAKLPEIINNETVLAGRRHDPRPVRVTVAVDRYDRPAQLATATARLESYEPNGPGCGKLWTAELQVKGHRLVAAP